MDNRNVVIAAILGLVLIEILTLYYKKEPVEEALRLQTAEALEYDEAALKMVEFDGRDATLRGEVDSREEIERLEKLVSEVWDVRVVDNQLTVKEKIAAPVIEAPATAASNPIPVVKGFHLTAAHNDRLVLNGEVHDESSRNLIVAAVLDAFPAKSIDNQIRVTAGNGQPWVAPLIKVISAISVVKNPEIEIKEDNVALILKGEVAAEIQKKAVLDDLKLAMPASLRLDEHLVVVLEERDPKLIALEKRIQDLQTTTRIQFKINTANLEDLSKVVLDQVAEMLNESPGVLIEIQGHTDNLGQVDLNMELSQLRANAVRTYLISKGIAAARLTAVGYGPTRPVATNTTRQGRITNRRVVFSLKGGS